MRDLEGVLRECRFFEGLDERHFKLLTGCASNVKYNAGDNIFREGEDANHFYIIRHGMVSLELYSPDKGSISIQTLGEGDVLGWSWLIPPYFWAYDAKAVEPTRAITLDGKCLRNKCEADHDLGYELLKRFSHIVSERLHAANLQLLDMYGAKVAQGGK